MALVYTLCGLLLALGEATGAARAPVVAEGGMVEKGTEVKVVEVDGVRVVVRPV